MGSGGCAGGSRFDPPDNVRPLQWALWLKELADFPQGAMHDRVDDNGAEERGSELLSFLELLGRLARLSQHARPDGRQVMPPAYVNQAVRDVALQLSRAGGQDGAASQPRT